MTRRYVANPRTAWEEYFDTKKEWLDTSKLFWYYVGLKRYEDKVCRPDMSPKHMFFHQHDKFRKYYCFLHHEYQLIYEE